MSFSDINIQELASAFMVLFAVIDITEPCLSLMIFKIKDTQLVP